MEGITNKGLSVRNAVVNGVIEQYLAQTTIVNADNFIEFIDNLSSNTSSILSGVDTNVISAVALSSTSVFIAHSYGSTQKLYGVVCTISGTTITHGSDTLLLNTTYINPISAVALSSTSVFIAYNNSALHGMVCTISGTTITHGSDTAIIASNNAGYGFSATKLSSTSVFIAHGLGDDFDALDLYGVVCTISGTTITHGSDTLLSDSDGDLPVSAVALSSTSVFIAHSYGGIQGMVCTISGTTITHGSDTLLSDIPFPPQISATKLSSTSVFIAINNNNNALHGVVCTISGTTITHGSDTLLSTLDTNDNDIQISATALSNRTVFIGYYSLNSSNNKYMYGILCTINGTSITYDSGNIIGLLNTTIFHCMSAVALSNNLIFIGYSDSSINEYLAGMTWSDIFKVAPSNTRIDGLTKTTCTTTTPGNVWELDI